MAEPSNKPEVIETRTIDVAGPAGHLVRFYCDGDDSLGLGVQVLGPSDNPDEASTIWFDARGGINAIKAALSRCSRAHTELG